MLLANIHDRKHTAVGIPNVPGFPPATYSSALSLALVPAFALTLLSGCQQTAAPPAESSSTGKGGHVIAANTWGVGAYPLDIIFEALTPLETSAGDLSIDLANNEFKVDKVVTDLQNQLT